MLVFHCEVENESPHTAVSDMITSLAPKENERKGLVGNCCFLF
jgi:hypothetical protein